MTLVNPTPWVRVDGVDQPIGLGSTVAAIDSIEATWGRRRAVDHHDPQTARVRLIGLDGTDVAWLGQDWTGRALTLGWRLGDGTERTFFRGNVETWDKTPRPYKSDGTFCGAILELTATGKLADLANRRTGVEAWPDETGKARLDRLRAIVVPATVASITTRPYFDTAPVAARSVNATDVLSLLKSLLDSFGGDRLTYDPHTNAIGYARRRAVPAMPVGQRKSCCLFDDTAFGQGTAPRAMQSGAAYPMLDGRWIEPDNDAAVSKGSESRVTRVEYSWTEGGSAAQGIIYDPADEAAHGIIAFSLSTEWRQADYAGQSAGDWLDSLWREGSGAQPPPMTYRADRAGGFPSLTHAQLLIGGAELFGSDTQGSGSICYVTSTPWPLLGVAPLFGVIGGVVRYVAGAGWQPTFYGQACWWDDLSDSRPIRCGELAANPGAARHFTWAELARSVTFADLRRISPPDNIGTT